MGAWGNGVLQNDITADVVEAFEVELRAGTPLRKASRQILAHPDWAERLQNPDQAALIWLGIASVEWKYGELAPATLRRVKKDLAAGHGLSGWAQPDKRRRAVEQFISKLSIRNPSPRALPKGLTKVPAKPAARRSRFKPAGYAPGDCLAVKLRDGRYTAAYVVASRSPEEGHGSNVVLDLDYLSKIPPTLADFRHMKPLRLTHGAWRGQINLVVYPPRNANSDSLATLVGNKPQKYRGYQVEFVAGIWVNWSKPVDRDWLKMLKESGMPVRKDDPSLHSLAHGDWALGAQRLLQQEFAEQGARRKRRSGR